MHFTGFVHCVLSANISELNKQNKWMQEQVEIATCQLNAIRFQNISLGRFLGYQVYQRPHPAARPSSSDFWHWETMEATSPPSPKPPPTLQQRRPWSPGFSVSVNRACSWRIQKTSNNRRQFLMWSRETTKVFKFSYTNYVPTYNI